MSPKKKQLRNAIVATGYRRNETLGNWKGTHELC